jgi:hypothetical protein
VPTAAVNPGLNIGAGRYCYAGTPARRKPFDSLARSSRDVRKILSLTFVDLGMQPLKNIEPIRAYTVNIAAQPFQPASMLGSRRWVLSQLGHSGFEIRTTKNPAVEAVPGGVSLCEPLRTAVAHCTISKS